MPFSAYALVRLGELPRSITYFSLSRNPPASRFCSIFIIKMERFILTPTDENDILTRMNRKTVLLMITPISYLSSRTTAKSAFSRAGATRDGAQFDSGMGLWYHYNI